MHLSGITFEESSTATEKQRVPREDRRVHVGTLDQIANVSGGVTGSEETGDVHAADLDLVAVHDLLGEAVDAVVAAKHGQVGHHLDQVGIAPSMIPENIWRNQWNVSKCW